MPSRFVLALDQGTTGSTALIFDERAKLLGRGYSELTQRYPRPGWVEHDPQEIWELTLGVARKAISSAGLRPGRINVLGITNQRETTLLWDRQSGTPLHPAIVWQCRRTTDLCEDLRRKGLEGEVRSRTGLLLDPYFSATKLTWLLDRVSGARKRAEKGRLAFGTVDSWLVWKLTGGLTHATDPTNASRTLLFDIHERKWSSRLCHIFQVPFSLLPEVRPSNGHFGTTSVGNLGAAIPIRGVVGDQQAALYGHRAVRRYQGKCTFGTGAFAVIYCGEKAVMSAKGLLSTIACGPSGEAGYAIEGSVFVAGAVIQWLRDGLQLIKSASETEAIARSVDNTGGVYLIPAFVGLGAPYWDPNARGAIVGITRGTERAHIVRAALEGIAYQTADLFETMTKEVGRNLTELRVDGGAAANGFLMQFLADLLGVPVIRPSMLELTGFGAARLAAVAEGIWHRNLDLPGGTTRFRPKLSRRARETLLRGWRAAIARVRSS